MFYKLQFNLYEVCDNQSSLAKFKNLFRNHYQPYALQLCFSREWNQYSIKVKESHVVETYILKQGS
jgi:hypothetical protein